MSAKKQAVLGLLIGLGLAEHDVQRLLHSTDDTSDWMDIQWLLDRLSTSEYRKQKRWTYEDVCIALEKAEAYLTLYREQNIHVVAQWEASYPVQLQNYSVPSLIMYAKGDISTLQHTPLISLVGSREGCSWSYSIQKRLAYLFVERGYGIVSGLAKGLDTAAHLGCLQAKGKTIAVLAHGFGAEVYPKENQKLAQDIVEREGCLVTTYGWGTPPLRKRFLERNHIQVGLSRGLAFTAAAMYGGTSYTVRLAEKIGIPVGYFYHEQREWSPRELNEYYASSQKGTQLSSQQGIALFLEQISGVL